MRAAVLLVLGLVVVLPHDEPPAGRLRAGTTLIYESGGRQSTWIVDSAKADSAPSCGRAWLRIEGNAEARRDCVVDGGLLRWNARDGRWVEQRPVIPNATRRYPRARGTTVDASTGSVVVDTIGGIGFPALETTMVTRDSSGTAIRRLRERYSVGLTTATWGVFEIPDGDGWKVEREFKLVAVRDP